MSVCNGGLVILDMESLGNYILMLSLGKPLPPLSYQLVLFQTRQGPNKNWLLQEETELTSEVLLCSLFQVMSLQDSSLGSTEVCSWEQADTHCSPIFHTQQWVLITCAYHLPFFLFLFPIFLTSNSCQIILTSPASLVNAETNTCVLPHSFQETSWHLWEPWGKGLRPPSWADTQQQLRSTVPSFNCYPLMSSSSAAPSLCWIQHQAFCSFPRNDSFYPASQSQPSTLLITGSPVSPSTRPLQE